MKLFYVDESGDTIPLSQSGKQFLVLTGSIIDEADSLPIEKRLPTTGAVLKPMRLSCETVTVIL